MGIFRGLLKGRLGSLVTCIVQRSGDAWEVLWVSDGGRVPADFNEESLTSAVERAAAQIAQMYAGHIEAVDAELQFAIYPWGDGSVVLEIDSDADGFSAHAEAPGDTMTVRGETLEELVEHAAHSLPDPSVAMLHWVRKVSTIRS